MNNPLDFSGKVALVTGAAAGMGLATAQAFAAAGAAVVLADFKEDAVKAAAQKLTSAGHKALAVRCDVSDDTQVAAMVDRAVAEFGRLDAAFNNAGVMARIAPTADSTREEWERVIGINLRGVWSSMKHELRHMERQGSGAIVNNASVGALTGNPGIGTLIETARFGELAVLAVLGTKSVEAIQTAEVDNFKGKVVIDTTYPLDMSSGLPKLVGGLGTSSGELNQKALPGAFVAKERHRQLHRIPGAWGWSLQTELRPSTTEPAMPRPSNASRYSVWRWIYSPECSTSLPKPWAVFRQPAPARTTNVASNRA